MFLTASNWESRNTLADQKKILMCGCHMFGERLIRKLIGHGYQFGHFLILSPEQGAHYGVSGYCDFRPLAEEFKIPYSHPGNYALTTPQDRRKIADHEFDLLIQGGWQRLFPDYVLERMGIGAIGNHGSADFLPKGRGRSPMNWSLIEDRKRFISHLFLMKPGADDGDVFDYEIFDITPHDDIHTLYLKNTLVVERMILRSLPRLVAGDIVVEPQTGSPSYYLKRTPEDGRIDWDAMDVWQLYNFIRAQTKPYPGAFGLIEGMGRVRIWKARPFDTRITFPDVAYGSVVDRFDNDLIVNCRGGLLLVEDYDVENG